MNNNDTLQLTDKQKQDMEFVRHLLSCEPISTRFPITVGTTTWADLQGYCAHCRKQIPKKDFKGTVANLGHVAMVDALGYCTPCNFYNRYSYRLHENRMSGIKDGKWKVWESKKVPPSIPKRIFVAVLKAWFYLFPHKK